MVPKTLKHAMHPSLAVCPMLWAFPSYSLLESCTEFVPLNTGSPESDPKDITSVI